MITKSALAETDDIMNENVVDWALLNKMLYEGLEIFLIIISGTARTGCVRYDF